jgi:hypothetical protein
VCRYIQIRLRPALRGKRCSEPAQSGHGEPDDECFMG